MDNPYVPQQIWDQSFAWFPRVTVDIVVEEGGTVLLVKRDDYLCKCWHLPGGFVRLNEPVVDAVLRIAKVEANIDLDEVRFVRVYDDPKRDPRGHVISLCFKAKRIGGEANGNTKYFPLKELPALRFQHDRMISDALRK